MARVNVLKLVNTISKESVTHPDVNTVHVTPGDVAKPVKEDTDQRCADEGVDAEVSNTKTTQPGPKDGGGNGTADFQTAEKSKTNMDVSDVNSNLTRDQNGGRDIDVLPNKVKPKDGLSASDVSTSVESHEEGDETTGLKTMDTGGAEGVGEADDLVMDIDSEAEAVDVLSQTEIDNKLAGKILTEVGELENAKAAVESYLGVLISMERRGVEMSNELRAVMAAGLKTISVELFEPEVITLENYRVSNEDGGMVPYGRQAEGKGEFVDGDDTEFDGARDKTKKGLTGKLKQIWEAIKRAFFRSLSALQDVWNSLVQDTTKVSDHLKDLKGRVRELQGGTPMQIKNAVRLMVGNEFAGDSPEAIKKVGLVANELLLMWPSRLGKIAQTAEKDNRDFGAMVDVFETALEQSFRNLKNLSPDDKDSVPSGFLNSTEVLWSQPLVGNRALYVGINRSKASGIQGTVEDAMALNKAINIDFSAVPAYDTHTGDTEIVSISSGDAQRVIAELSKLMATIAGRRDGIKELDKIAQKTKNLAAFDFAFKGDQHAGLTMVLCGAAAQVTAQSEHAFIGYLISMVKAYIGFIEGSIKAEAGPQGKTFDA